MSTERIVLIVCDECGERATDHASDTAHRARFGARGDGWLVSDGSQDFCPDCREARRLAREDKKRAEWAEVDALKHHYTLTAHLLGRTETEELDADDDADAIGRGAFRVMALAWAGEKPTKRESKRARVWARGAVTLTHTVSGRVVHTMSAKEDATATA